MENTLNSRKKEKILSSHAQNTLYCSDVYNLAQKLDNSIEIVKITGHAWRRKVVLGLPVTLLHLASVTQAPGLPSLLVNRTLVMSCGWAKTIWIRYQWTRTFFENAKNLRFPKYPDTCRRGLRLVKSTSLKNKQRRHIFNNYSLSPNGLWVNSPWGRRPNGLLTQRPWGREE